MRSREKMISGLCFVSLLITLILGCGVYEAQAKKIQMIYANGLNRASYGCGEIPERFLAKVNEVFKGRLSIRGVHNAALLTHFECLEGVQNRVADLATVSVGYYPTQLPTWQSLATVVDVDLGSKIGTLGQGAITHKLVDEFPQLSKEFADLGITYLFSIPGASYLMWCRQPIRKIEDLKGKRFRTYGSKMPLMVKAVGATPMSVDWGEIYTSLDTGLVDVVLTDAEAGYSMKWHEPAKWVIKTHIQTATVVVAVGINTESLQRLSEADQKTFLKMAKDFRPVAAKMMDDFVNKQLWSKYEKDETKFYEFPKEELVKWGAACPDWYSMAGKELNKKGLPGTQFVKRYKELANDYISVKWQPYK